MIVATTDPDLLPSIVCTEDVEDGVGPVAIVDPARYIDDEGTIWYAVDHQFGPGDARWLVSWTRNMTPGIVILEFVPPTWRLLPEA